MPTASEVVREVIDRAWNRGDLTVLNERVADGYRREVPGTVVVGRQGFAERITATRAALADFRCEVGRIVEDAGSGVATWTVSGTHRGELNGVAPTGRQVSWRGMVWFRVEHGQLVEEWELFDQLGVMEQLAGLTPVPRAAR